MHLIHAYSCEVVRCAQIKKHDYCTLRNNVTSIDAHRASFLAYTKLSLNTEGERYCSEVNYRYHEFAAILF